MAVKGGELTSKWHIGKLEASSIPGFLWEFARKRYCQERQRHEYREGVKHACVLSLEGKPDEIDDLGQVEDDEEATEPDVVCISISIGLEISYH